MSDATLARMEHGKYVGVREESRRDGIRVWALSSVHHFPEKSGIYHFLINFSSGMGEWYMKVVFEVLILFSLLSLISFT